MAGDLRKAWRDFKKKHPDFENSKNFKSDVGPQLDKFDKAREEFAKLQEAVEKQAAEVVSLGKSVAAALKGYAAVVKELQESDTTIKADFSKEDFDNFEEVYVKQYAKKINWN